ncbi:MAG: beta-lactamase family protein [Deltaproteobacteria bacterium]|nr:beta-lactamase family protein [Deltaproteobacteria bacterium]
MKTGKVHQKRNWLVYALLLIFVLITSAVFAKDLPTATPAEVGLSSERLNIIDTVLKVDIEKGKIEGAVLLVARKGKIAYFKSFGMRNKEKLLPMEKDSIFRVYSMTKPVVGVAVMMLLEDGKLVLSDPVTKYIPAFKDIKVAEIKKDETGKEVVTTVKPRNAMTIQDLLRHTSGLTYWFWPPKAIQSMYLKAGMNKLDKFTNAEVCEKLATLPLVTDPGIKYTYSRSYDVLGRVVEVVSGMSLDKFLEERIFKPLKIKDSRFKLTGPDVDRLVYLTPKYFLYTEPTETLKFFSGGGGLVSTAMDFARFAQMLLNGGELDGKRLLGPRTVAFMTSDHLGSMGNRNDGMYVPGRGYGSGFGFYVRVDAGNAYFLGNVGEFYKGGAAGTVFWVDPTEDLVGVFMVNTATLASYYRYLIKTLIYQAIVD